MRRRIVGAMLGVVAAVSVGLVGASPASAAPTGCGPGWAGNGSTYTTGYCSGGTGTFQVWAACQSTVWPYYSTFVQSSWLTPGNTAWAVCPFPYQIYSRGLSRRN